MQLSMNRQYLATRRQKNNSASWATALGYQALLNNSGSVAIAIGHEAGENNQYDRVFIAGDETVANQDSQIIFGNYFTQLKANNYRFNIDQSVGSAQDGFVFVL